MVTKSRVARVSKSGSIRCVSRDQGLFKPLIVDTLATQLMDGREGRVNPLGTTRLGVPLRVIGQTTTVCRRRSVRCVLTQTTAARVSRHARPG